METSHFFGSLSFSLSLSPAQSFRAPSLVVLCFDMSGPRVSGSPGWHQHDGVGKKKSQSIFTRATIRDAHTLPAPARAVATHQSHSLGLISLWLLFFLSALSLLAWGLRSHSLPVTDAVLADVDRPVGNSNKLSRYYASQVQGEKSEEDCSTLRRSYISSTSARR